MSSSLPQTATNSQSLNGIITLSDGVITIEGGVISGLTELDLIDLQVSDTATIENLVVNNQIDMTLGQIKNVAAPTDNDDATNKQYVDTNFLNKVISTTQTIGSKVQFNNATTDIVSNPVITMFNITGGSENGNFLRFQKGVVETTNTQIGGLSACDKNAGNTIIRVADLIFSRGTSGEARMDLKVINGNRNPLTITDGVFISRNNRQYFQKQDGTNLFNYLDYLDYVAFAKDISLGSNNIINLANGSNANDAVNKGQLDLKADTTYLDTNFLNKTTTTTQNLASRVTFNSTTSGQSFPIIELTNAITGNNKGMYLQMFKDFVRLPDTEIGSIVFADKEAITGATNRAVQLTASIDSGSNPLFNISFDSGLYNPLTITNTQTFLRTNDFYIKNKTTLENVFTYLNSTDKFTMSKPLDCVDFNSGGNQILGTNSSSSLNVKSSSFFEADVLIESNKHLAFYNSDFTTDSGMKMYFDRSVGTLGTFFMDMRGSEIRVRTDPSSAPTSERVKINNNETTINNNLICNGNINLGNNTTGDTTTINSVATFNGETTINNNLICNGTTSFNDDVLIESNKHLAFNSGTLSSTNGMLMNYDGGVGFLDIRGSEFRIRTSSSTTPSDIRFKVNDLNTSVINNFFVDGNTTLGNDINNDTTTFNSKANFPDGSKLTFNSGADCEYQSGADLTFKNGSNVLYQIGANLTFNNIHTFNVQSYINGARINLIRKTSDFKLGLSNVENGVISDPGSSGLIITMPNTGGGTGLYWNRRHYIIKLQDGGQTKLRQNSETTPTRIDENTGDIDYNTAWKTIQLVFDENYSGNGKIHIISDR